MRAALVPLLLLVPASRAQDEDCGTSTGTTALIDLGAGTYEGHAGGLYPGGTNEPPEEHRRASLARAAEVVPRDAAGAPDPERGLIGLIAVGLSSTAHEFARFERDLDADTRRNARVVLVNGAQAGKSVDLIADASAPYWDLLDERVRAVGLTPEQVQVAWVKQRRAPGYARRVAGGPEPPPRRSGPNPNRIFPDHAELLRDELGEVVRHLRARFPGLVLCYLSDRTYGDYARAEPQCYEAGFGVKWLIERQLAGRPELNADPERGALRAPLLLWGPYLWADGRRPNGLRTRWCRSDYEQRFPDHPSAAGERKVAQLLTAFLANDPSATPWFADAGGGPIAVEATADAWVDAAAPDQAFGAGPVLRAAHGDTPRVTYVRFDLDGVERPVVHAKLSFRVPPDYVPLGASEVFLVADDDWEEESLTYDAAPALGAALGELPRISRDGTRALDVTAAVNAHGDARLTLALAVREPPEVPARTSLVVSREGGDGPRLVLAPAR